MKKGRGDKRPTERYWKKYNGYIQTGLSALGILEALPDIEYPKPNKDVRIFLTKLENRFGESDLGIRKQVIGPILSVIRTGLIFGTEDKKERAKWFIKIVSKLGIEMSIGSILDVLDGLKSMDDFLRYQVERKFEEFFSPKVVAEEPEEDLDDLEDLGDNNDDLAEPGKEMVPVTTGEAEEEEEEIKE